MFIYNIIYTYIYILEMFKDHEVCRPESLTLSLEFRAIVKKRINHLLGSSQLGCEE